MKQQGMQLQHPGLWQPAPARRATVSSTGWKQLDSQLPEGGWSRQCLYAIDPVTQGEQELAKLLPSLCCEAELARDHRWIGLIAPPKIAWASRMAQANVDPSRVMQVHSKAEDPWHPLWALEQALRTGTCGVVFAWLPVLATHEWRRLQLLAKQSDTQVVIFLSQTPSPSGQQPSRQPSLVRYCHGQRPLRIALDNLPHTPLH